MEFESPYFKTIKKLEALLKDQKERKDYCECDCEIPVRCACGRIEGEDFIKLLEILLDE